MCHHWSLDIRCHYWSLDIRCHWLLDSGVIIGNFDYSTTKFGKEVLLLFVFQSSSSSKNFTTPYKSVPELSLHHFNAPLPPGFSEAEKVLNDVTRTRAFLEANLQTVLRSQHESEVYAMLGNLYHDRYGFIYCAGSK
jgi:hypothetical protein